MYYKLKVSHHIIFYGNKIYFIISNFIILSFTMFYNFFLYINVYYIKNYIYIYLLICIHIYIYIYIYI